MKHIMLSSLLLGSLSVGISAQETQPTPIPLERPEEVQAVYFISLNGLKVRATPEDNAKTLGLLSLNDKVKLVEPGVIHNDKYVEVTIVRTSNKLNASEKMYIAKDYISLKYVDYKEFSGKYFVVVNVATETLRLYERKCLDNSCPHKMLMETEVVVGEDRDHKKEEKGKGRSILGSYRVTSWAKFYQDADGHYPAWYRDGYPGLPTVGDNGKGWFSSEFMPADSEGKKHGSMRGAFGWYAAFVTPEPFGQWTHGTIGWGEDKDKFIKRTKKTLINIVSNPRSSGCTRNNNEAIAFLRSLVDTGTPIIKIYAKEALLDESLSDYPETSKTWDYILTKKPGQKSDLDIVTQDLKITKEDAFNFWATKRAGGELIIDPKSPLNQILEVGTYEVDIRPDVIPYTPGEKLRKLERQVGRKGNVYGVKSQNMFGTFYVDSGLLENYNHPTETLEWSGFQDEVTPPWMDIKNVK